MDASAHPDFVVTQSEVDECFLKVCKHPTTKKSELLREDEGLAKFKLIRWDQLSELAEMLLDDPMTANQIASTNLVIALNRVHDAELKKRSNYTLFSAGEAHARRDHERLPTYEIDIQKSDAAVIQRLRGARELREADGKLWLKRSLERIEREYLIQRVGDDGALALKVRVVPLARGSGRKIHYSR